MKNKFLIILVVFVSCYAVSCNKTTDSIGKEDTTPQLNSHRVKRIVTKGIGEEDYQILFNYDKTGMLTYAFRCGMKEEVIQPDPIDDTIILKPYIKRDTLGYLSKGKNTAGNLFTISDYVINIDKDSVARLKAQYPESYLDTLKKRRTMRTRFQYTAAIKNDIEESFFPRTDFGVGMEFNNQYLKESKNVYLYEYDRENRLVVARYVNYKYNPNIKLNDKFDKITYKTEFSYSDKQLVTADLYKLAIDGVESWEKYDSYHYSYSNGELTNISGTNYNLTRSVDNITIVNNGITEIYTFNDDGYITKIEYSDGKLIEIEYEEGNGNFGNLYMTTYSKMLGIPIIR